MADKIAYRKTQLKTFWYFINERHSIYLRRFVEKRSPPYTKDKILSKYKFTNVFRQLDRVTLAWVDRFVRLLGRGKEMTDGDIIFHCAMFRLFNWPETYDALFFGLPRSELTKGKWSKNLWVKDRAIKILEKRKAEGKQIFTGAYIVTSGGRKESKIVVICEALQELFEKRDELAAQIANHRSMEKAVEALSEIYTIGPFVAYEIACDLRYTRVLAKNIDSESWANPGPGAKRGIHRLLTGSAERPKTKKYRKIDYNAVMRDLLIQGSWFNMFVYSKAHARGTELPFEMREIEHSLCEFDKYMRVKNGEGRPRSLFTPTGVGTLQHELPL